MYNIKLWKIVLSSLTLFTLMNTSTAKCAQSRLEISNDQEAESVQYNDFEINENSILLRYKGKGKDVKVPTGVKRIKSYAFSDHPEIESIELPEGLIEIENNAFSDCTNLKRVVIPDSVEKLGSFAFSNCINLENVYLGKSLNRLGELSFFGCDSLYRIDVSQENENISSKDGVLFNKEQSNLILCPSQKAGDYFAPETVKNVYPYAFFKCDKLERIVFSNNLLQINDMAFYGCNKLRQIGLGEQLTYIGSCAFGDCISLQQISLPESLKFIGSNAFFNCRKLGNTSILSNDVEIEYRAFCMCDNILVYCFDNSSVEKYVKDNDIDFILI